MDYRAHKLLLLAVTLALAACDTPSGGDDEPDDPADGAVHLRDGATNEDAGQPDEVAVCGDGVRSGGENCEPGGPGDGAACDTIDVRFVEGVVRCTDACELDLSACVQDGECGDGVVDVGEACDDGNTDPFDGCSSICEVEAEESEPGNDVVLPRGAPNADIRALCTPNMLALQPMPDEAARVRVKLHVLRHDGRLAFSPAEVRQRLTEANVHLSRASVELIQDGEIDIIDDPFFFDLPYDADCFEPGPEPCILDDLYAINNSPHAIDLYFVNQAEGLNGVAVLGGDSGLIARSANQGTLAHEVGHILGLEHTHSPDLLSDTPPDPGRDICDDQWERIEEALFGCDCSPGNDSCQPDCPGGERPEPRLVMSYYTCGDHLAHSRWSPLQVRRMHCQVRNELDYARIGQACVDRDGDGFSEDIDDDCPLVGLDCNDRQPTINPMAEETCNGRDDDCDGRIDEDTEEVMGRSGGACQRCTAYCVDGVIEPCEFVDPSPETCNAQDDDCDGMVDENLDPLAEGVEMRCPNQGICAGEARQICDAGTWRCDLPLGYSQEECRPRAADRVCAHGDLNDPTCNDGVDNDCDGVRDEHNPILVCREDPRIGEVGNECFASNRGRCADRGGVYQCVQLAERCGVAIDCVGANFPEAERCDAEDWDCDGAVWDRNDRDGDGFGDCAGQLDCNENDASVHPGAREICDGIDNDCDGARDEGFGTVPCGNGICRRNIPTCQAGRPQVCTPQLAVQGALAEECDGLDNDCDGRADEGDACTPHIALPNIGVFNLALVRGDHEFGGNGPSVVITVNIDPHPEQGLTVRACVDAQELGGDSGARRCETRHVAGPGGRVALLDDDYAYFRVQYIDTDHARDNAIAERRAGSQYVRNPAVTAVSCNGDRRGPDVGGCADCTGCQIDLGSVPVRLLR